MITSRACSRMVPSSACRTGRVVGWDAGAVSAARAAEIKRTEASSIAITRIIDSQFVGNTKTVLATDGAQMHADGNAGNCKLEDAISPSSLICVHLSPICG